MIRRWLAGHRALLGTAIATVVVAAVIATVAVVSTGYTAQRLDLGDGSVWVPNGSSQVIGRANTQVYGLDTVVTSTGSDIQVVQRGSTVLLFDHTNAKVDIVDPATSKVLDSVPLPPQDPLLFIAGPNVVVGSGGTGELWIMPIAQLAKFDAQAQPTLSLGANLVTSETAAGVLYAFSRTTRQVYRVDAAASDSVSKTSNARQGGTAARFTITSVGGHWVILDPDNRRLYTDGGTIDLSTVIAAGRAPVLQQAATEGDSVLIGYNGGLVRAPLGGGSPQRVVSGQNGTAVAPTVVGDCSYAAWSGGGAWRKCGPSAERSLSLKGVSESSSHLAFASNGTSVVLNDSRLGTTWAVQGNAQLIDNWSELITVKQDQQIAEDNTEDTPPDYDKTQSPPVAVNDAFGARPGRTSVLPVLLNDYDSNGDVLVVTDYTPIDATIGHLDLINNDQQLQVTLVGSASGSFSFGYTISDGRGGSASAVVSVTVRLPSENSPPVQVRSTKAIVVQGGRVTTSVLGDWVDPDGDAFYLVSASTPAPDAVSYKPEGSVVFTEGGASPSVRTVALNVSDGTAAATGSLSVTVKSAGQVPIIADPFVVLAYSGQETTVSPLDHVRGGTGTLRLASVPAKTGATITASLETGTFRFTSTQVGTYYLEYVINDGDKTATGLVRIDVAAPPDVNTKPITIPKTVFIKTLSSQTIDVASTDIDPAGGVLLVTGVYNIAANSGIRAEVIDERAIRVTLVAPLADGPVSFNYRITNGLASAEGVVTVVEIAPPVQLQPPIANDDSVTVRVGDAIDIPVLDNDVQPDGEPLTLNPQLTTSLGGNSGLLFASGQVLRYLAPNRTGDFTAIYEVSGPDGQVAQAQVKIAVREAVASTNNPPVPVTVTARVLAGETVTIPIPLTGIDPDGDSVQLLGQATGPQKGSVTSVGADTMDYQAGDYSSGTDSFTYTVVDSLGARATGTVRVGISPKVESARNPVAIEDSVTMRPGGTVSVQVLANDSDPDGGTLTVTKVVPNSKNVTATIVGDVVRITPPATAGTYGLVYTIRNDFGGTSSNFITVTVDPNAPRAFPVANDTVLTLTDILGRNSIDVNVLRNVFFADGSVSSLRVSVLPGYENAATVTASKRLHVTVERSSQIIPFAVANPDDPRVVAYAFVWVPGLDDALPQLNRKAAPLSVASESTLTIDLDDYVLAVGGKQVRLTDTTSVQATHSNGDPLVVNSHTLRFTSAEKYFGPASISFEVTDGTSASDPNGHTATLVLPIKVTARTNQPPVFVGGVIDFEPAESKVLDLSRLTNYPYPDDEKELEYTVLDPQPTGFTYTLTGQKLTVRADASTPKGSTTSILIGVKDAVAPGQSGRIQLNVVSSSLPLASPVPDTVLAPRGQTVSVDVLANDEAANPFPGQPLRVIGIRGLGGGALPAGLSISPSGDNSRLTVSASSDATPGNTSLQYEVADATGDPGRYVWGSVTVSVQDRPDPVSGITATSFGDRVVSLRWAAGPDNNSPITGFSVLEYGSDGGLISATPCSAAICDVATPGNGPSNAVRFSVVAINAIGSSDPASLGSALWSDIIPPAPTSVTTTPLDGGLRISWRAVSTPAGGSDVDDYRVTAGGTVLDIDESVCGNTTCSTDVTGLTNGQPVTVTVSARNGAYAALATWNSSSTSGTPAGKPIATGSPVAAAQDSTISVTWAGLFDPNGRSIDNYTAIVYPDDGTTPTCDDPGPGGSTQHQVSGGTTSTSFPGLTNEQRYLVLVLATNSQGCSASSSATARTGPGVVTAKSTSGPTADGDLYYDFTLVAATVGSTTANGDYSFYYRLTGGGTPTEYGPISLGQLLTANADQYGSNQTVQLRACRNFVDSGTLCQSQWSANFPLGTPVDPQLGGLVFQPDGDLTNNGTFTWTSWPTGSGYSRIEYSCSANGNFTDADVANAGSCHATPGIVLPATLTIRITANGGNTYLISYDRSGNVQ